MTKIRITLTIDEIATLEEFISKGKHKALEITRARILLLANQVEKTITIVRMLNINKNTVARVKNAYNAEGLKGALEDHPRSGQPRKYDQTVAAEVIALACTTPPEGRKRWTLRLLTKELQKRGDKYATLNRESIRLVLKKQYETVEETHVVH